VQGPSAGSMDFSISPNSTIELIPCSSGLTVVSDSRCKLCVSADQANVQGNTLFVRPIIRQVCGTFGIGSSKYGQTMKLVSSPSLACGSTDSDILDNNTTSWSTVKIVLVLLVAVLLLGIVIFAAYFAHQKYNEWRETEEFMRLPNSTDDMANVSLNQEEDSQ